MAAFKKPIKHRGCTFLNASMTGHYVAEHHMSVQKLLCLVVVFDCCLYIKLFLW